MLGERREVGEHLRFPPAGCLRSLGLLALAGEHQHRPRAGGGGGLRGRAARRPPCSTSSSDDVEAPRDLEQHARLAACGSAQPRVRGVRAEEERVDAPARLRRRALQRVVDREQRRRVEQAARDARLVGRHHDAIAGLRQARDRLQAALDRPPLLGRLDVVVAVVVDGAVAVEDDELHCRELGEIGDAVHRAVQLARAARGGCARTRASLSITITLSKNASTGALQRGERFQRAGVIAALEQRAVDARGLQRASNERRSALFSSGSTHQCRVEARRHCAACLRMLPMRLLAAARLSASGSAGECAHRLQLLRHHGRAAPGSEREHRFDFVAPRSPVAQVTRAALEDEGCSQRAIAAATQRRAATSGKRLRSTQDAEHAERGAAQAEGILLAGRHLADAEQAAERIELVGERERAGDACFGQPRRRRSAAGSAPRCASATRCGSPSCSA